MCVEPWRKLKKGDRLRRAGLMYLALAITGWAAPVPAQISAGTVLHGRVIDQATRAPIAGAEVTGPGRATTTNERGEFEIVLAGQAAVTLTVQVPGFLPRTVVIEAPGVLTDRLEVEVERAPGVATELVVTGQDNPPPEPTQEVTAKTVAQAPGAIEDAMQALKSLPGIVSRDDWSSRLFIRGGRPDQNGIYLDGIPIYDPYRLFGLTSLFNPETLESLTLYPGGFDARYGDRLSAVLAGENRVGSTDRTLAGSANLSLTNANLMAEGRLRLGFPSSWLVSVRRTYFDLVATDVSVPRFTDLQARVLLEPSPRHRLTLTLIGCREDTNTAFDNREWSGVEKSHTEAGDAQRDFVLGLQGRILVGDRHRVVYAVSRTTNRQTSDVFYRDGETGFESRLDQSLAGTMTTLRTWSESALGRHLVEVGGEVARSENRVGFHINTEDPRWQIPDSLRSFATSQDYWRVGGFAQDTLALTSAVDLKAGVRWDRSGLGGNGVTSPRASLAWRPGKAWELRAAWGEYFQSASYETLQGDGYFLDLRGIKDAGLQPEHAEHLLASASFTSTRGWKLALDLYNKRLDDLFASGEESKTILVLDEHDQAHPYTREEDTFLPDNARRGFARGAQVVFTLLEGRGRSYYGMLAYSFGQVRTRDDKAWRWESYDQRHSLLLVGGWKLGRSFEVGWKWHYASGFPYTPLRRVIRVVDDLNGDGIYDPETGDIFTYQRDEPDEAKFSRRLPPYHRLDLRVEYARRLGDLEWTYYLDIINAYARKNVEGYAYNADFTRRKRSEGLPFLPSVGVKARF